MIGIFSNLKHHETPMKQRIPVAVQNFVFSNLKEFDCGEKGIRFRETYEKNINWGEHYLIEFEWS
jgi:hypothetical protein